MLISRLLLMPVLAGELKTKSVLPLDPDHGFLTLLRTRAEPVQAVGETADDIGTKKPPEAPTNAPPGPVLVPTPAPPVPLTSLSTESVSTTSATTSTTTLAASNTDLTSSDLPTTFTSFSTIVPLSSVLSSSYSQALTIPVESPATTSTPSVNGSLATTTTATSVLSSSTNPISNMTQASTQNGGTSDRTLVITLSTVLSVVGVVIIAITSYLCLRNRRRRSKLFNRGITPIDDDEIATWKVNRGGNEKSGTQYTTRNSAATRYSHRKAPSNTVIQYQSQTRPSIDALPQSPRSFLPKQSFEGPQSPQTAMLAKAPNARSGLTDDTVPGDQPFVAMPKRQPSKLSKSPPMSSPGFNRPRTSRGSRSSSVRSFADAWYGDNMAISPRTSSDYHSANRVPSRVYSNSAAPPRLSLGDNSHFASLNDSEPLTTVLSPPPLHRTEIGRAIG